MIRVLLSGPAVGRRDVPCDRAPSAPTRSFAVRGLHRTAFALARCGLAALAAFGIWCPPVQADTPKGWDRTAYAVMLDELTLHQALNSFSRDFALKLDAATDLQRRLRGPIKASSASGFLDRLGTQFGFSWFVQKGTLYVSDVASHVQERIAIDAEAISESKAALIGLGLFEPKFGWGELPEASSVVVSGPAAYVQLVKSALASPQAKETPSDEYYVFPLKHASVTDRTISYRNKQITIPGVAAILKGILGARSDTVGVGTSSGRGDPGLTALEQATKLTQDSMRRSLEGDLKSALGSSKVDAQRNRAMSEPGAQKGIGIEADVRSNSIIIRDVRGRGARYARLISDLDRPQPLVEIEAMIIDVDQAKLQELGVDWSAGNERWSASLVTQAGTPASALPALSGARQLSGLLLRGVEAFYARIRLLESNGDATVVGRPSVLTLDNQTAVIDLTQSAYLPLVGERVADVQEISAGTLLRVTPRRVQMHPDAALELLVDIEDGSLAPAVVAGNAPTVKRGSVTTQAVLADGQSLAIGGYRLESEIKSDYKVPLLGDIPLIGAAFRGQESRKSVRERLFVITPRFVRNPAETSIPVQNLTTLEAERRVRGGPQSEFNLRNEAEERNRTYAPAPVRR